MDTSKACMMAIDMMRYHGLLNETAASWHFGWHNRSRTLGTCDYRAKTISLSRKLVAVNSEDEILDTILHEIAHALTPKAGHGLLWKVMAQSIGARPSACTVTAVLAPSRLVAHCAHCSREFTRERQPKRTRYCAPCYRSRGGMTNTQPLNFTVRG